MQGILRQLRLSKKARWAFFDKKMQPAARIIFAA